MFRIGIGSVEETIRTEASFEDVDVQAELRFGNCGCVAMLRAWTAVSVACEQH